MKRVVIPILFIISLFISELKAQNPFEKYGYHVKVLTMTNGKFNEFFDLDSIQQVGDVLINTHTMKVIGFAEKDSINPMPDAQLISRWISPDPMAEKYWSISPYAYVENDPINYIDPNGKYKLPSSFINKYPHVASYLKNNVKNDVMNSSIILNAFSNNTAADNPNGVGNLTRAEVEKAVTWNSGPMIIARDEPGGMYGANGYYSSSSGQIELSTERLTHLENILASDASHEDKLKALSAVYMTLLHETVHYGDYLDGLRQDGGEPGVDFESEVWQSKEVEVDGEKFIVNYFFGDKYNPDDIQEIIDEKRKTEEGKKTLPTVPEN